MSCPVNKLTKSATDFRGWQDVPTCEHRSRRAATPPDAKRRAEFGKLFVGQDTTSPPKVLFRITAPDHPVIHPTSLDRHPSVP